jgi:hypothetical protein
LVGSAVRGKSIGFPTVDSETQSQLITSATIL